MRKLVAAGTNDKLPKDQKFTSVGYGTGEAVNGPAGHTFPIDDVRHVAVGTLNSVTKSWLRISRNGSHGDGGTCFGIRRPELPRGRRKRDEGDCRDHDHGRLLLPLDERGLPPGHALGTVVPGELREPAVAG